MRTGKAIYEAAIRAEPRKHIKQASKKRWQQRADMMEYARLITVGTDNNPDGNDAS